MSGSQWKIWKIIIKIKKSKNWEGKDSANFSSATDRLCLQLTQREREQEVTEKFALEG